MKRTIVSVIAGAIAAAMLIGCDQGPASPSGSPLVTISATFGDGSNGGLLLKASSTPGIDSLRIDSAIVILARVKFERHHEEADEDSAEFEGRDDGEEEAGIVLRGPFVVRIRENIAVDFASQTVPAGMYDAVKFKVHRLMAGDAWEDSDERMGHPYPSGDSLPYGSSIVIWGAVLKDGGWVPFEFRLDRELEFKVNGDFTVPAATSSLTFALRFDTGLWFMTPEGRVLDPTDVSIKNRQFISQSIIRSFERCRGGHDRDKDGDPDEDAS